MRGVRFDLEPEHHAVMSRVRARAWGLAELRRSEGCLLIFSLVPPGKPLPGVAERFDGIRWRLGHWPWVLLDFVLEELGRGIKLRVRTSEGGVGKIIDRHVGIDAVTFDEPFAFGAVDADFSGGGDASVSKDCCCRTAKFRRPRCACR